MVLLFLLVAAVFFDFRLYRIPNWLALSGAIAGVLKALLWREPSLWELLIGLCIPLVCCGWMQLAGFLGGGDVKLFMVCGIFLGSHIGNVILLSFLCSGVYALAVVMAQGNLIPRLICFSNYISECVIHGHISAYHSLEENPKKNHIHFSVGILAGYLLFMAGCTV